MYRYVTVQGGDRDTEGYMMDGYSYGTSVWEPGDSVGVHLDTSRVCRISFLKNGKPMKTEQPAYGGVIGSSTLSPVVILSSQDDTVELLPMHPTVRDTQWQDNQP